MAVDFGPDGKEPASADFTGNAFWWNLAGEGPVPAMPAGIRCPG